MKHIFAFAVILLPIAVLSTQRKLTDCLKPWQKPLMTVATISEPATPLRCHPETDPCPQTAAAVECQFSFRSFSYVCCEDRGDVRAPVCPKYHDTLNTFCGGTGRSVCPNGYKCLKSRYDSKIELCCRPNPRKVHPEPETSFVDHSVSPMVIAKAPKKLLTLSFNGNNFTVGQLISSDSIQILKNQPEIYVSNMDESKQYTVMLFDMTTEGGAFVLWFVPDVSIHDDQLILSEKKKSGVSYRKPLGTELPYGTHIVVAVLFQQKDTWSEKDMKKMNLKENVNVKRWLKMSSGIISKNPVAGTLFGFKTSPEEPEMEEQEEEESTKLLL